MRPPFTEPLRSGVPGNALRPERGAARLDPRDGRSSGGLEASPSTNAGGGTAASDLGSDMALTGWDQRPSLPSCPGSRRQSPPTLLAAFIRHGPKSPDKPPTPTDEKSRLTDVSAWPTLSLTQGTGSAVADLGLPISLGRPGH